MNNQMQRGIHGSDQEEHRHGAAVHNPGLHSGVEHNAPHDEKKSVLKKVKEKAKKIKDIITKHGHHGDEHAHDEDDAHHHRRREVGAEYDYDEEEDNDEIEVDPEAHGAPIYESKEVRTTYFPASSVLPSVTAPQPTPQVAAPTMVGMGHYGTQHNAVAGGAHGTTTFSSPISVERHRANISNTNPGLTREEHNLRDQRGFIPGQVGVAKHDDVVTFGGSQTHTGVGGRYTGASGTHGGTHPGSNLPIRSGTGGITDRLTDLEHDPQAPRGDQEPSNYQSKVQDPSKGGGQQMGLTFGGSQTHTHTGVGGSPAQPASHSLGYSGASGAHNGGHHGTNLPFSSGTGGIADRLTDLEHDPQAPSWYQEPSNYQSKVQDPSRGGGEQMGITHVLHSLDKMTAHGDETKQRQADITRTGQEESMFKPNAGLADENRSVRTQRQTPYGATTESRETSGALTATPGVTDKGISAKDAVASKLGFGGEGDSTSKTSSAIDYGKNVASTVYGKLAEASGAVMSKMPGSHAAKQTGPENLSPGEEDKALSDASTETSHKTSNSDKGGEQHKEGKVTFSATVVKQLGSEGEESAEDIDSGVSGPAGGEPMVNMLRDTVTSWLGIKHDPEPSSLVWHDIPKDTDEGLSEHYQQGTETERKGRLQ